MTMLRSQIKQTFLVLSALIMFALPMQSQAQEIDETPSAAAMVFDGLIVRPITLVATAVGTVIWVATLPFSLLGGNAGDAAEVLVLEPAKATFIRCLGCTNNSRKIDFED
ncbi:hypothetical protein [Bermanella sp. R86510]|uniref:hypothetical protein n=1 Tax=unclassified Bermanella TaxID=2627862 RepID=UPI0037CBFB18